MKSVTYTDREGRRWRRLLPEGEPDEAAPIGIPAGPPPIDRLGLPLDYEVRLHNELFDRGLYTVSDLRGRTEELRGAIQAAFRIDVNVLLQCYQVTPDAH